MARVLSLPLTVASNGALATITQDNPAEIAQSIALLLDTRPGDRRGLPDYGLPDPVFDGLDREVLATVIAEWEPRADAEIAETVIRGGAEQRVTVRVLDEES